MKTKIGLFILGIVAIFFIFNYKNTKNNNPIVEKEKEKKPLVVHVTREFQPLITYGGLGSVLGSIAHYQTEYQKIDSWIIIPFYTFLSFINRNEDKVTEVTLQYKDRIIIGNISII